jgi:glycosyltransferase involved in cell wall biosynthesis
MRILVINYEYPPIGGGGGFVTRDIIEEIAAQGHNVTVITSHYKKLAKQERLNGVNIIRVPVIFRNKLEVANMPSMFCYLPASIFHGFFKFNPNTFDVINTHFAVPSGPAGYVLSKVFKRPNVLSIHGGDIFDPSKSSSPHNTPIFSNVVTTMLKSADRVVAQSTDTKRNAYTYYKINRPIEVIPLGIKKPVFNRKRRSDFGLRDEEIIFSTIGRLVKRKNIDDICSVLSHLKDDYSFKFLIIGDGPEREHLENLKVKLNLDDHVHFLGNVNDEEKFQILDLSDFYLSTALHEGFGLVFLEAMECGLPVVCYNRGGQNDFLISGKTGYLVELGDKDKFRSRIVELINNAKLKARMREYNRRLIQNYYISTCAEKYIALFDDVICENSNTLESSD